MRPAPEPTALHADSTTSLPSSLRRDIRILLNAAFDGDFSDNDWQHALGGTHVWIESQAGGVISHASLVERTLVCAGQLYRAGYVEAMATAPALRGRGYGALVIGRVGELIRERHPLGALSTGAHDFYRRFGWQLWRGPTFVEGPLGRVRTPDDDGGVMVLVTPRSAQLDLDGSIVCDWRAGDVW